MGFSKLKTGTPLAATAAAPVKVVAPAPAAAPIKTVTATVAPVEVLTSVTTLAAAETTGSELSVFGAIEDMSAALATIIDLPRNAPAGFPVLQISGGASGGAFTPASFVAQEIANQLPQGKKPIDCVFMCYRTELSSWPVGYDDKTDGDRPVFSLAVSYKDVPGSKLAGEAAMAYQYTPKANKKSWDYASSGFGHMRTALQLLVYLPSVDDIIIIQTTQHYTSWKGSLENLGKCRDSKTGVLTQFPCQIRPVSIPKTINGNSVTEHTIDFAVQATDSGKQWWDAYAAFKKNAAGDNEIREKIEAWVNCTDRPLTDSLRAVLQKAAAFKA